ncbi:hypothetical protein ARMGADRAFT_1032291 [Armillaria gallica]|uniref:Transmembrane protein n=1 Tax=Armillaria gallica TaxID=47427 RepID=A0A2H3D693_ARMGA|nr:hypothetical protein ARMGADRAFT_1032291 [Armillaria gallica]
MAAAQTNTPPDLTDAEKAVIFQELDVVLNATILYSLLCEINSMFVNHGQNLLTKFVVYISPGTVTSIGAGVVGAICSILADSTMCRFDVVGWSGDDVFKIIGTYKGYINPYGSIFGYIIYTFFVLASTLWCTSLIIYRVVTVTRAGGGLKDYRHVLEVLVESLALYSISLILCIAFLARNDISLIYFDTLAAAARGIAPTLLVGRVAAGHARPDTSWQGSVISGSLRFKVKSESRSSQPNSMISQDLEAPEQEVDKEYGHFAPVADSQEGGACEDGSEVRRLGDVSVDSGSHDICQDSSGMQQEKDVEYGHHT